MAKLAPFFLLLSGFVFGFTERLYTALTDGYLNAIELGMFTVVSFFIVCILFLKP